MVQRVRKLHLGEPEVRHNRSLGELGNGCPHQGGHRVHQALAKRLLGRPRRVEVQRWCVHRHGGEKHIVGLGHGSTGTVQVPRVQIEFLVVGPALLDDFENGLA